MENANDTIKMRTFRAFDTQADAKTFQKFLQATGYEKVDAPQYVEIANYWRVWFEIKD